MKIWQRSGGFYSEEPQQGEKALRFLYETVPGRVLLRAEGVERNEVDIFSWVRQGDTISEIIDKGGYF